MILSQSYKWPVVIITFFLLLINYQASVFGNIDLNNNNDTENTLQNEYIISGKVHDGETGEAMTGVNVYLKENIRIGSVTNNIGKYTFPVPAGEQTLVFSFLGYEAQEIKITVNKDLNIDVTMKMSVKEIEEVQIISERKFFGDMDRGRTIESIESKEIEQLNINNASDLLHARLPGVWSTKVSGAPGDHQKIRIRGINSLFGSVDPLYVVNGVPVPNVNLSSLGIADINIYDIENVTVLKDASSTALYGYQGGNGVVLIDTKSGGRNEIAFSTTFGVQRFTNLYDLMNTLDFLAAIDSGYKIRSNLSIYYPDYSDSICNTDWQDVLFQDGIINEYQLSASGSINKIHYYLSGNYHYHKGVIVNSSYKRYTFTSKISRMFGKKFKIEGLYMGALQNNRNNLDKYGGNALLFQGINKSPCFECTPEYFYYYSYDIIPGNEAIRTYIGYPQLNKQQNIKEVINNNSHKLDISSNTIGGFAQYRFTDELFTNISSTLSFKNYKYKTLDYLYNDNGYYVQSHEGYIVTNQQINLNWNKSFGYHQLKFLAAYRIYADNVYWNVDSANYDFLRTNADGIFTRGSMALHGETGSVIRKINSLIGHVNYNYKSKYFISAVANYDHLKEGKYVDVKELFPSVAISWDISRDFNLEKLHRLDYFNIYINWGQAGNYPLNGLSNDMYTDTEYTAGDTVLYGTMIYQLANHKLRHEKIEEYNIGFEISLFNKRVILNTDYYFKTNSDLIMLRDIPYYYIGGRIFLNTGKTENRGIEITLELFPVLTKNFTWYTRFNYSSNNQKINKLSVQNELNFIDPDILVPDFIISTQENMGSIIGYKYLGVWTDEDELADDPFFIESNGMKYYNKDTSNSYLNSDDKVIIGNSLPDFTFNFYSSFSYKNFTADFIWYAVIGMDKYNATRAATYIAGTNRDVSGFIDERIPCIRRDTYFQSSAFIEDASFIRLKQLTFSYTHENKLFDKIEVNYSLSFDNLITITRYKGYDPEATIYTDNNFSDNAIDRGAFPAPKAIFATVQLKF